jgi:Protein of unknown function (DUF2914)/Tetratricopeptide repeat
MALGEGDMAERDGVESVIEAAEQAASAGDFGTAEALLRRALELQEAALGAGHPELANTLNNLGVVYERLNRPADAEGSYRRAFAVARAALGADHPAVATSAENLREFCTARGVAFEPPAPSQPAPPKPAPAPALQTAPAPLPPRPSAPPLQPVPTGPRPAAPRAEPVMTSPTAGGGMSRTLLIVSLVVAALILLAIVMRPGHEAAAPPTQAAGGPAPAQPAPEPQVASPPPSTKPQAPRTETAQPVGPAPSSGPPPPARPAEAARAEPAMRPTVLDARLCRALRTGARWRCTPLEGAVGGGTVYFFTTLASRANTTIQHRWYRGDRLHQAVTLRVGANPDGYRTYSQMTVASARTGDWRVEIRAADGTVLRQERFTVGH